MSIVELPAVAKSFFTYCKKCDADRYHKVLAHTSDKAAKVQCEVCGGRSSYKIPKAEPVGSASKAGVVNTSKSGRGRTSEAARMKSHIAEYDRLMESNEQAQGLAYNMKFKFDMNQKLSHPKFGVGFIRMVQTDKIEVLFQDEIRTLIHNRQ